MRLALILFVVGILCIVSGITQTLHSGCSQKTRVKIVPRHVYDELLENSTMNVTPVYEDLLKSIKF